MRRERERRQIALESIAANTKISAALFAGLERDDVSRWPAGIFRRAFIRAYADAVGLDADETTREFLARFPDPAAEATPEPPTCPTPDSSPVPTGGAGLRLTFADVTVPFTGGRFLTRVRHRGAAAGCDAAAVLVLSGLLFLALGAFWMPLALSTLGYYLAAVLLLGNTPGVYLFAPTPRDQPSPFSATPRERSSKSKPRPIIDADTGMRLNRPRPIASGSVRHESATGEQRVRLG